MNLEEGVEHDGYLFVRNYGFGTLLSQSFNENLDEMELKTVNYRMKEKGKEKKGRKRKNINKIQLAYFLLMYFEKLWRVKYH